MLFEVGIPNLVIHASLDCDMSCPGHIAYII